MTTPEPTIEIVGQPEPLTGVTVFACRCGMILSTADYPRFADYEKARKDHRDACPMRFDKPWPFDRLPSLRKTPGATDAPAAGLEPRSGASDLPRSSRVLRLLFPSAPRWVVRRVAAGGVG